MKKLLLIALLFIGGNMLFTQAAVPSFDDNFADFLVDDTPDEYGRKESVFNLCISRERTLMQNVRMLFYPNFINVNYDDECMSSSGGLIRDVIRIVGFAVMFVFIVFA